MRPQDRIHRSGAARVAANAGDRPPLLLGRLGKGARVRLLCGACAWSKTYDPYALVRRLQEKAAGGPSTPIAHVARHVQWPCPACRRMAWATTPEFGSTSPSAAALAGGGPPAAERAVEGEAPRAAPAAPSRTLITKRARAGVQPSR